MEYKIFGCKTNRYYTEKWLNTEYLDDKPGVFVASCIVTEKAKAKWLKFVIDTIQKFSNDEEKIYLSGCGTIKKGDLVEDFYNTYPELLKYKSKIILLGEDPKKEGIEEKIAKYKSKIIFTRKYVIIQNGCDNYCTFCLTIQARGQHFSRDTTEILSEINEFIGSGGKEIVITGTNLGSWGSQNTREYQESELPKLLTEILEKTKIKRIRISSLGIEYISEDLLKIFKNKRIYAHLHLSIQSGSDKILKLMNRNYSRDFLIETLEKISKIKREDGILQSIGADIIVGFPGEEETDFKESLDLIKKFNITKIHAFPFSAHENRDSIPAAKFPNQVKDHIKQKRMKEMLAIGKEVRDNFLINNSGKKLNILIEKVGIDKFSGWSENYIFLNEENFIPANNETIERGKVINGTYRHNLEVAEKGSEIGF